MTAAGNLISQLLLGSFNFINREVLVSTMLEEGEYVAHIIISGTLYDSHEFTNERERENTAKGFGVKL